MRYDAPRQPTSKEQDVFLGAERTLGALAAGCPWWCTRLCAFRDSCRGLVLYASVDGSVCTAYMLLLAFQNPRGAVFLELHAIKE